MPLGKTGVPLRRYRSIHAFRHREPCPVSLAKRQELAAAHERNTHGSAFTIDIAIASEIDVFVSRFDSFTGQRGEGAGGG